MYCFIDPSYKLQLTIESRYFTHFPKILLKRAEHKNGEYYLSANHPIFDEPLTYPNTGLIQFLKVKNVVVKNIYGNNYCGQD